jgi:MFS family permease
MLALIVSIKIAKSIKRFHSYRFTLGVALLEMIVLIFFGNTGNHALLPFIFIIHFVLQTLLYIMLNVFIESFSAHAKIASIRGLFLAIVNLGVLISPLIGGIILTLYSFKVLYTVAALLLIPYMFLVQKYLSHVKEPAYHTIDLIGALRQALRDKNLKAALMAALTIESFYAVMIIYSPIYLSTLGIPLTTYMTIILPIALIPLVILPYELGFLADKKFGEKEMLIIGLLILAVATFLFVVISVPDVRLWALVLLFSRIGASFVETMAFGYYFKKIGPEDPSLTALFINMRGTATIIVGTVGVVVAPFLVVRPQLMFLILGCAILWNISYVLPMKDTR